jgi:phosphatidylserine decarboxylase
MNKKIAFFFSLLASVLTLFISCKNTNTTVRNNYGSKTKALIRMVDSNSKIKTLLIEAIDKAHQINPDTNTNPVRNLNEFYNFISWSETAMPWDLIRHTEHATLYNRIDQSLAYLFFITDIPLPELSGKGYYNNSLQYEEPFCSWLTNFDKGWGSFLDSKKSWNNGFYQLALTEDKFGLQNDWYEDASHWNTFNQFFTRRLKSLDKRPIASPEDESVVVSPTDAMPQGTWAIDGNSKIVGRSGVVVKTSSLQSVKSLLGADSKYCNEFADGTFTHTFLDVGDYHRYHFPLSGVIKEIRIIPATNTSGGVVSWDSQKKKYLFDPTGMGYQTIETRGCIILQTEKYGLVALLPIGMSPVSSVNFLGNIKVGTKVFKGDEMGYFLFGGSDFIMIFQKKAGFVLDSPKGDARELYKHLLMGKQYGRLTLHATGK